MSRFQRWKEPLKTLLLLALLALAVFLAVRTGLFSSLYPRRQTPQPSASPDLGQPLSYQPAALPLAAAVTGASGLRYGVAYDPQALRTLYENFGPILGEALGSAGAPEPISEETWQKALCSQNLYLDYGYAMKPSVLAAWLGTTAPWDQDCAARRLLLGCDGAGGVTLCFLDGQGKAWRCQTMAVWSTLQSKMDAYLPNGAEFAFCLRGLGDASPYALVLETLPPVYAVRAASAQNQAAAAAAARFGVNLRGANSYLEPDGTQVYLGENGVLRIKSGDALRYTVGEGERLATATDEAARIETARWLLAALREGYAQGETLRYLRTVTGPDTVTVCFGYLAEGLSVTLDGGLAAWAVFRGDALTELGLRPRTYAAFGEPLALLPAAQAAAAAGSLQPGAAAVLCYHDGGDGLLSPIWVVETEGY